MSDNQFTKEEKEYIQSMIDKSIHKVLYITCIPLGILIYFLLDSLTQ